MPAWLLTSSLSPQRWSQTSCAVSARCCESWTGTTPPASATEVRQTPGTAPGGQHPPSPVLPYWGIAWPQTPHRSPLSVGARVGGHGVASPPWCCSALSNLLSEVLNLWQDPGVCRARTSAAFILPLRGCYSLYTLHSPRGSSMEVGHQMPEFVMLFPALTPTHHTAPSNSLNTSELESPRLSLRGYCFATHCSAPR